VEHGAAGKKVEKAAESCASGAEGERGARRLNIQDGRNSRRDIREREDRTGISRAV
jgi:hypothetical protein